MKKQNDKAKFKLALLRHSKKVKADDVERRLQEVEEISKLFASSILILKGKK